MEEVVRYSHFDIDAVHELITDRPALAKASWDWGFGDWESALGAAS
ncbi:MAG: ankyrin repeat domain-containing protein, partial [Planctomycetes bacterium]|nr:ankyrin repeat domain-containing protein [Planctomycetota bacterium]